MQFVLLTSLATTTTCLKASAMVQWATRKAIGEPAYKQLESARDVLKGSIRSAGSSIWGALTYTPRPSTRPRIEEPEEKPEKITFEQREAASFKRFEREHSQSNHQKFDVPDVIRAALEETAASRGPVCINVHMSNQHTQHAPQSAPLPVLKHKRRPEVVELAPRPSAKEVAESSFTRLGRWLSHNKLYVAAGGILTAYAIIQASMLNLQWTLMHESAWSCWKKQCTLEDLYRVKQGDLIKDLMSICEEPHDARATALSFKRCIAEIDNEIATLKRYRSLTGLIDRNFFRRFFFYDQQFLEESNERVQRLLFIRSIACKALTTINQNSYESLFQENRS